VVLTSRFSASASEILAGALQDYGRALIVGDVYTHGKGTVQTLQQLARFLPGITNDPGTLKLTIRKFYRAGGASTQRKGVMPDIVLPSERNYWKDIGEASQDNNLEWDSLPSASFNRLDMVSPYLSDLLQRSTQRTSTNQDFVYIREDIQRYRERLEDKTISLNEARRLAEKKRDDEREKARKEERRDRTARPATVYEITLKNVDQPGLPEAIQPTNTLSSAVKSPLPLAEAKADESAQPGEEEDEPALPEIDVTLEETERILLDYISLLSEKELAAVKRQERAGSVAR